MSDIGFVYGNLIYDEVGNPRIQVGDSHLFITCLKGTEGQFTGQLDKNGVEIYEDDVIKFQMTRVVLANHPVMFATTEKTAIYQGPVKWGGFGWRPFVDGEVKDVEVVGNIHQNPELVGGAT
jgi:uncharacterized phage protein (TIGR01671 family)